MNLLFLAYIAVTTAMEGGGGMGECPHEGGLPLHPVPHQNGKRYKQIKNFYVNENLSVHIDTSEYRLLT
jgi:hypothetical protein